jgi:hypothetical protein
MKKYLFIRAMLLFLPTTTTARKKVIILTLFLFIAMTNIAFCERQGFGLGVIVGEPTGVSMKNWLSSITALDAAAAWSFGDYGSFQFHADYLLHNFQIFESRLPVYYGIGGRVKFKGNNTNNDSDEARVGIRFPVGITYLFQNAPFDFFFEIVPILDVSPETDVKLNAALGARFYFGR